MNDTDENLLKECVFLIDMPGLMSRHEEECIKKIMKWVESSGGRVVYHHSPEMVSTSLGADGSPPCSYTHVVTETGGSLDSTTSIASSDIPRVNLVYVFACLQCHRILGHRFYAPLPSTMPERRGFPKKKKICSDTTGRYRGSFSGFVGRERVLVEVMMQSLGIDSFRALSINGPEKAHVLVASDTEEESHKILAARSVGIPVVNVQWLCDCFQEWAYLAVDGDGYQGRAEVDCIVREDVAGVDDPVCIPDSIDEEYSSTPSCAPTEADGCPELGTVVEDKDDEQEEEEDTNDGENNNNDNIEEEGEKIEEGMHDENQKKRKKKKKKKKTMVMLCLL